MANPKNESYFAPPADAAAVQGVQAQSSPAWGEDAEEIARTAGLGSYGAETLDQEAREEAVIRGLERTDGEVRALRAMVNWLCVCVVGLGVAVGWIVMHGR
jgi:hypothetical protein